jgi:peptidoglycan/LPS O-acetylase OafA/YrhL
MMSKAPDDQLYPNLDLLRTIAVSCVYAYHLPLTFGSDPVVDIGRFGVLLFFVHTSLVLMMSLERLSQRGEPLFRSFYIRRLFRIYPLSVACVCLIVLFHLPGAPWWQFAPLSGSAIVANLLLYMNLTYAPTAERVLWSLPYEVQMYLLLPVLFLIGKRFGVRGIAIVWVLAVAAGLVLPQLSARLDFFGYVPCFVAGVLAYFLGYGVRHKPLPAWVWPAVMALGLGIFGLGDTLGLRDPSSWITCALVGVMAPLCREMPSAGRLCHIIAKYSYGIYLTHLYAMWAAFVVLRDTSAVLQWSCLVALSVALPLMAYHLLEAPFIRMGSALASRLTRTAPRVESATPSS